MRNNSLLCSVALRAGPVFLMKVDNDHTICKTTEGAAWESGIFDKRVLRR